MLASQEEPNQHPNDFIISQGLTIPSRKGERGGRKGREEGEGGRGGRGDGSQCCFVPTTVCSMSALTCM